MILKTRNQCLVYLKLSKITEYLPSITRHPTRCVLRQRICWCPSISQLGQGCGCCIQIVYRESTLSSIRRQHLTAHQVLGRHDSAIKPRYEHAGAVPPCSLYEAGAYHALGRHPGLAARCNTYSKKPTTIMRRSMIIEHHADVVPELKVSTTWCRSRVCMAVHTTVRAAHPHRTVLRRSSVQWPSRLSHALTA